MPTKTESIKNFLNIKTHSDLANLYNYNMECQVNVAQDGGERITGDYKGRQWTGWSDGLTTWKSFRVPYNAKKDPTYEDSEIKFDLAMHAEGIGMTGWNWKDRMSQWVAFDFDAITSHSKGLTVNELDTIRKSVEQIPWVTVRRSTSGKGLHLYVFLSVPTENHDEHAALARAVLGMMSAIAGVDFSTKVDACGGNMWVWHRKMAGTEGLVLLKQGVELTEIPENWRDHLKVITGSRRKNLPQFVENPESFDELAGQRTKVPLDEDHKKLIAFLRESNAMWWWDADHHMLVTHTIHLKEAYQALSFRGVFDTIAQGTEKGADHNCFSGDTEIITREGVFTLKELVNQEPELLVRDFNGNMIWVKGKIQDFGIQETIGLRFGDTSVIRVTKNHQWLYRDNTTKQVDPYLRKYTTELIEGKTQLPLAKIKLGDYDPEGYAHGFVYGDGWLTESRIPHCEVALFKRDNDLFSLLLQYGTQGSQKYPGHGYVNMVRQLPRHWKELPEKSTKSYALGFILGLVSADGFVSSNVQIFQSNIYALDEIRKIAIYAGLYTYPIRFYQNGSYPNAKGNYALSISTYNLSKGYFIRKDHQKIFKKREKNNYKTISCIRNDAKLEPVYCAVVPSYHNFTLANHIITGNCFAFPKRNGAWAVRRFTPGVQEHSSWVQDGNGYTKIDLNKEPDLPIVARANEGVEDPAGGFVFRHAELAIKAASSLGVNFDIAKWALGRSTKLKEHKDGRLIVEVEYTNQDYASDMPGWLQKGKHWIRMFQTNLSTPTEPEVGNYDDIVRHLITESGDDYGWVIKADDQWRNEPLVHVRTAIESLGFSKLEVATILGSSIFKCWKLTNLPFQPEYPGDRSWNRGAAQLRYAPSSEDILIYPTWNKVLNHCGKGLDDAVKTNAWCRANALKTGGEYLKCWISSLIQEPREPLPYLFFYGPQNSGKSIFHEAIELLITRGYVRADTALINQQGFNGELENAIVCIIEETDLRKDKQAYNRIKDWVTSRLLPIHRKQKTPYNIPNSTHWIQCSNEGRSCPIFPGDTRIVMIYVDSLDPIELIPKKQLIPMLEKEAPYFISELLHLELPPSNDRLNIPVITTSDKLQTEQANKSLLELFIDDKCYHVTGSMIKFSEFWDKFQEWADPNLLQNWSKIRVGRELPPWAAKGRLPQTGQFYVGNISWVPKDPDEPDLPRLVVQDRDMLVPLLGAKNDKTNP